MVILNELKNMYVKGVTLIFVNDKKQNGKVKSIKKV